MIKTVGGSVTFASLLAAGLTVAEAGDTPSGATMKPNEGVIVTVLMRQELPDIKGKEVTIVSVSYAPGAASLPHRHPGSTFAYVLEGSIVSEVAPGKAKTYKKGEMWSETPLALHKISRNASATKPAKLLAFLISDIGQSILLPPS
jgi:quercetin dioxygenase-like cupin family protein